jgi:hypothetical protein
MDKMDAMANRNLPVAERLFQLEKHGFAGKKHVFGS